MKLILPLNYKHELKTKKDRNIKYSLNNFLLALDIRTKFSHKNVYYETMAKKHIQDIARKQLHDIKPFECNKQLVAELCCFRANNMPSDLDNISIIYKFVLDVVKESHIVDDNWKYIPLLITRDMGLDRENPRAELNLIEIDMYDFQALEDAVLLDININ